MNKYIHLIYIALFCFCLPLKAQVHTGWRASLGLDFEYYFQAIANSHLTQSIASINPRLMYSSQSKNNQNYFVADVAALLSSEIIDSHVYIPQLFFNYTLSDKNFNKTTLTIGRKKINWSLLEADWKLGLLGSYFKVNPLRSQKQGLFGVFYKQKKLNFEFTAFASPIFIPHQSGTVQITGGTIKVHNRWQTFVYYDNLLNQTLSYKLENINIYKFVQKWSLGVWAKKTLSNVNLIASAFYKPYADPYIYPSIISRGGSSNILDVLIRAKAINHYMALLQAETKQKYFSQYISVVFDQPEKINFSKNSKQDSLVNKKILALGLKYHRLNTKAAVGVILTQYKILQKSVFSNITDSQNTEPSIYGYDYKDAVFIKINKKNLLFSSDKLSAKYTYIVDLKLDILSLKYKKYHKQHIWIAGIDILGRASTGAIVGIFASNVANDFVYTGWTYVF